MGLRRLLWRSMSIGRTVDTIKNIADEGSIIDGIKKTVDEDLHEDNPITSRIYESGRYEGKKEGYVEASNEYEQKLLNQADEFLKQKIVFKSQQKDYEELLDTYDLEINNLEAKLSRSEAENQYLQELLIRDKKLRRMEGRDSDTTI